MGARITPGSRRDIGLLNYLVVAVLGVVTGGGPPHLFTTLARHRRLFRRWLRFAGALMPGGRLPRVDTELVILRVAHNTDCAYEWRHHERLARIAGLALADLRRVPLGADQPGWSPRQAALLRAVDELHADRRISEQLWARLRPLLRDEELIELCLLVGHYEMLAMVVNSLGVEPDQPPARPSPLMRMAAAVGERRRIRHD